MNKLGILRARAEEMNKGGNQVKKTKQLPKKEKKEYIPITEEKEINIAEGIKLVFSVSKTKEGDPHVDIRTYVATDKYNGPTAKGINFHIENLEEFIQILGMIDDELKAKGM